MNVAVPTEPTARAICTECEWSRYGDESGSWAIEHTIRFGHQTMTMRLQRFVPAPESEGV